MHSSLAHPARLCRPGSAPAGTPWPVCPPSFKIRAVQNVPLLHAGTRLTRRASLPPPPPRQAMELPPTHGKPHRWTKPRSILEQDNNGYTL